MSTIIGGAITSIIYNELTQIIRFVKKVVA